MQCKIAPEKRHDGALRWRLTVWVHHGPKARRYREGFASQVEAELRRAALEKIHRRGGDAALAREFWGEEAGSDGAGRLRSLVQEFLAEKEAVGRRVRTLQGLEGRLGVLLRAVGDVPVTAVRPEMLARALHAAGGAPRNRINHGVVWRGFFNWAVARRYCGRSPMDGVELPSVERTLPVVAPAWRVWRLVAAAWRDSGGEILPYCLLSFFSGVRPAEVERLTWDLFNWERGEVVLDERVTKVSRMRFCRLDARLVRILRGLRDEGLEPGRCSRRVWRRVRRRAGLRWAVDVGRHTYASARAALGHSEVEIAADMGNSVGVLRQHYINRLVPREQARRIDRLLDVLADRLAPEGGD